jgi:sigma-B regulation protein RsbU (phosphoserine phosphatase)
MEHELRKNIRHLMETTAAKERIESELNVAREIQMGLVPKIFPAFPTRKEFDLYATLKPAREVGGDLYDFFFIDDDHFCFTVGDVSDKGVPAALFMAVTKTLIKKSFGNNKSPAEIMTQINNALSMENPRSMFVTLIIGVLNVKTGRLHYSNGGHNPFILVSRKEEVFFEKDLSGPVVGAMDGIEYHELFLTLKPGDALFLYTDGVNEAMDPENKPFSDDRLLEEIGALLDKPVDDVIRQLMLKIDEHVGSASQSDDIAMMMIRYNGMHEVR